MASGKQITLFAMDCGATNWRLYRVEYRQNGNQMGIQGEPQPSPLTSFSERKLPAIFTLDSQGTEIESIGEVSQAQLEDEHTRQRVREYFKPCIGSHLEPEPLPHQQRYSHTQALHYTGMLLSLVVEQIRAEKWRASQFDESVRFSFAYPVHWRYQQEGAILHDFENTVKGCFPENFHSQIDFIPEPEGAILSLKRHDLLDNSDNAGTTLVVDVGGSTSDIVAGQIDPRTGELLYLGRYGQPFGGGLYDAEMASYLVEALSIPAADLSHDPAAFMALRVYGQRLKESLSRQLLQAGDSVSAGSSQRMITLVMQNGQIYRKLIKLDQDLFSRIAGHLDQAFVKLIDTALANNGLTEGQIGQVALVGGGVQLFSIVRHLRDRFGKEKVVLADNPDEIVVQGVGLAYGIKMDDFEPGASLVIEPPPRVDSDRDAEPASEPLYTLMSAEGKPFLLQDGSTHVGRARESQIWLESDKASRNHAELRLVGGDVAIIDLGSTNGTFVNDERMQANQPLLLQSGDELRFGDKEFTITIE
jgi:hypothetical protein